MDPVHAPPPHAVQAVEHEILDEALQAGDAVSPRTLWLRSPACLLQVLCCVAFCGHPAWNFASLSRAFRGDDVLWGCIKERRQGRRGMTALMVSSCSGELARVRWLLARGADVGAAQTTDGLTSLMLACIAGHLEVVKELLAQGATIADANVATFAHVAELHGMAAVNEARAAMFAGGNVVRVPGVSPLDCLNIEHQLATLPFCRGISANVNIAGLCPAGIHNALAAMQYVRGPFMKLLNTLQELFHQQQVQGDYQQQPALQQQLRHLAGWYQFMRLQAQQLPLQPQP
jgi:hypothetical protein